MSFFQFLPVSSTFSGRKWKKPVSSKWKKLFFFVNYKLNIVFIKTLSFFQFLPLLVEETGRNLFLPSGKNRVFFRGFFHFGRNLRTLPDSTCIIDEDVQPALFLINLFCASTDRLQRRKVQLHMGHILISRSFNYFILGCFGFLYTPTGNNDFSTCGMRNMYEISTVCDMRNMYEISTV